jgi:small conductance mechanosensitive channel
MVLSELGINIAPLLAGAGVVGLAVGFGAQRLVQDVITGVFILFQDLMSVGDVVKLGDKAGVVEALSIRTVRLRDLSGTVHTIPFSAIEGVSNLTRDFSFYVFDLGVAYREDVDAVIALLQQIGEELRGDAEIGPLILEPLEVFGLDAFGDSAIMIKGRIKTRPIKQWQVGRAFNRLVKLRFDEQGIEIPFPHRTLYFGQDKDGSAPPAFVQLETLSREAGEERGVPA